ncbi:hypothetical protein LTR28_007708 [Elasticomyces elasticus]|nr:hypothetical protein LTR28_007708 [Elasticomyces elasticus]
MAADTYTTQNEFCFRPSLNLERAPADASTNDVHKNRPSSAVGNETDIAPWQQPIRTLARRQSMRKKVMTKVMEGFAKRSKSSHFIRQEPSTADLVSHSVQVSGDRSPHYRKEKQAVEQTRHSSDTSHPVYLDIRSDGNTSQRSHSLELGSRPKVAGRSFTEIGKPASAFNVATPQVQPSQSKEELQLAKNGASKALPSISTSPASSSLRTRQPARSVSVPSSKVQAPTVYLADSEPARDTFAPSEREGSQSHQSDHHCCMLAIKLDLNSDISYVDVDGEASVWIAVEAQPCPHITPEDEKHNISDSDLCSDAARSSAPNRGSYTCRCHNTVLGSITQLKLHIKPGPHCRVEQTIGKRTYEHLSPQQTASAFVRVRVPAHRNSAIRSGNIGGTHDTTLFAELDWTLGGGVSTVLTVEARYKHSVLPPDTTLSTRATYEICRPNPASLWSAHAVPEAPHYSVQRQLATYIATQNTPSEAYKLLKQTFEPTVFESGHPSGLYGILEGVASGKESTRLLASSLTAVHPSRNTSSQSTATFSNDARTTNLNRSTQQSPPSTHTDPPKPLPPDPLSPTSPTNKAQHPPTTTTDTNTDTANPPEPDAARRIWKHIRRTSAHLPHPSSLAPSTSLERLRRLEDEDAGGSLRALRRTALMNKRSVGADTLRGFAATLWLREGGGGEGGDCRDGSGVVGVAPWL